MSKPFEVTEEATVRIVGEVIRNNAYEADLAAASQVDAISRDLQMRQSDLPLPHHRTPD